MLERAFERAPGGFDLDDIYDWATEGQVVIWAVEMLGVPFACFVAGEIADDTVQILVLAGNNMDFWIESVVQQYCDMANANGYPNVHFGGRKGWRKVLEPLGFVYEGVNEHGRVEMTRKSNA